MTRGLAILMALALPGLPRASAQGNSHVVLSRLNTYEAPPFPAREYTDRETYDYRLQHGAPVPDKQMALVLDVCQVIRKELDDHFKPLHARQRDVRAGLSIYEKRSWEAIPGYRPWTHWNFVRSLSATDRENLASEIAAVMQERVSAGDG